MDFRIQNHEWHSCRSTPWQDLLPHTHQRKGRCENKYSVTCTLESRKPKNANYSELQCPQFSSETHHQCNVDLICTSIKNALTQHRNWIGYKFYKLYNVVLPNAPILKANQCYRPLQWNVLWALAHYFACCPLFQIIRCRIHTRTWRIIFSVTGKAWWFENLCPLRHLHVVHGRQL